MSDDKKSVHVRRYKRHVRRRTEFQYDPDTGKVVEVKEPTEPEVRSVEGIPPGFRYDPRRGEYVHSETGEVLEAREEMEAPAAPTIYRELPRGQHATRVAILEQASVDLTVLGYAVGKPEIATGGLSSGRAPDIDLMQEVEALRRQIGPTDRINRRGVAGALAILAVERRRRVRVTPTQLIDLEHPEREDLRYDMDIGYEPTDPAPEIPTAELVRQIDAEEDAVRSALRIVRERLRERERPATQ